MARQTKQGLDYFSHDVDMSIDQKMEYVEAVHGLPGYAVYNKLLELVYRSGYFISWNERDFVIYSKKWGLGSGQLEKIVDSLIKERLFDDVKFSKYRILTSKEIQERFLKASERRKEVEIIEEYLHIDINVDKNQDNVNIITLNVNNSTQSKVKESKVKEIASENEIVNEVYNTKDKEFLETYSKYKIFRAEVKKRKMSIIEEERFLKDLKKMSGGSIKDSIQILNKSIRAGYFDIFPLKKDKQEENEGKIKMPDGSFKNFEEM